MRLLLLGSAAIMLSGCSFLGIGGASKKIPNISQAGAISQAGSLGQGAIGQVGSLGQGTLGQVGSVAQAGSFGQVGSIAQAGSIFNGQQGFTGQSSISAQQYYAQQQGFTGQPNISAQQYYAQQQGIQPAAASRCHTGNCLSRWNLEGGIGPVFHVGSNIVTADRTNNAGGTDFSSVSFSDAYDPGVRAELGGSYALAPNTKVTLLGHYERADSDGVQNLGTINGQDFTGRLTDYEAYGVEVGLRQYSAPWKAPIVDSVRPYVEGRLGASRVSSIDLVDAQLSGTGPFALPAAEIPFNDGSWVPTAAGLVGVETPIARYTTLGLETGVRYQGGLESDTSVLGVGSPLGGLNNNNSRITIPLTLRGRYRF